MNDAGDLPIMYILMAVVILLSLLAALGVWVKGNGLRREEAENLFREAQEKHREELDQLKSALKLSRAELSDSLSKTQSDFSTKIRDLESVVANAAKDHGESLTSEMESINNLINDSERQTREQFDELKNTLENVNARISTVGDQVTKALTDIARQQRDQKAQSALQVCDALISSLGTLKDSISNQITDTPNKTVNADPLNPDHDKLNSPDNHPSDNLAPPSSTESASSEPAQQDTPAETKAPLSDEPTRPDDTTSGDSEI